VDQRQGDDLQKCARRDAQVELQLAKLREPRFVEDLGVTAELERAEERRAMEDGSDILRAVLHVIDEAASEPVRWFEPRGPAIAVRLEQRTFASAKLRDSPPIAGRQCITDPVGPCVLVVTLPSRDARAIATVACELALDHDQLAERIARGLQGVRIDQSRLVGVEIGEHRRP
jgi:hypothetical protein